MNTTPKQGEILSIAAGVGAEPRQYLCQEDGVVSESGTHSVKALDLESNEVVSLGGLGSWDHLSVTMTYESAGGFYDYKQVDPKSYRRSFTAGE